MSDHLRAQVQDSVDRADRAARRIRKVAIPILMQEMGYTKQEAAKAYRRLMEE